MELGLASINSRSHIYCAQQFDLLTRVSGNSMNPTLQSGNVLLIKKVALFLGVPKHGNIVIINEDRRGYSLVKRVIAV